MKYRLLRKRNCRHLGGETLQRKYATYEEALAAKKLKEAKRKSVYVIVEDV